MSMLYAALALVLALVPRAWGTDIGIDTARGESFVLPPALLEILNARGDDGAPIIGAEGRGYFDALPDHAKRQTADAVARDLITTAQHLGEILSLGLASGKLEQIMQDNCVLCHSNPDVQEGATLFSTDPTGVGSPAHMNLKEVPGDLHFRYGLSCAGCHGGDPAGFMDHDFPEEWPEDADIRKKDRSWIPQFCGRCHSNAAFMRRFNPALPTDQLAKYGASQHGGFLLDKKDSRAAQCVSCHGVHGIQGPNSPRSKIYPKNIPETCGVCHANAETMAGLTLADGSPMPTDQLEKYRNSVHGRALLERGDIGAAVCNDCHGNHAAMPPGVTSVGQICRTCHAGNGTLFDGSKHKEAFDRNGWPECGTCHGNHAISKTNDAMVGIGENSLCTVCHAQYAKHNPNCNETAAYFHDSIVGLNHALETFEVRAEGLAEKGLDVDLIADELNRLTDFVKQARSYVHSFDRSDFRQVEAPGREVVRKMERLVEEAEAEYRARRTGLLVSVFLIGCVALFLYLKLRRMERPS